jgi:STE24 endopeptidase
MARQRGPAFARLATMDFPLPDYATAWTLAFCALLLAVLLTRLWLASRQIRHVAGHRGAVPLPFASRVSLASHQKAADYTIARLRLDLVDKSWNAALLLAWTLLGGLDWLNQALRAVLGDGLLQQLALLAGFFALSALLELPQAWVRTFRVEQRHGFNRMSPGLWLADGAKSALVGALIGLPLAALLLWLMESAGALWWLWCWAVWLGFNLLLLLVYPTLIAPLFNRFEPLADASLRERIEALMARCGFRSRGLYVMDGSRRSAHANAYFTGFGSARRVVFFDTLLQKLAPGEIDAVLAHELGHFRRRHLPRRLALMGLVSLLGFALLGWLSGQLWFYLGLGVRPNLVAPSSALALLLFASIAPLAGFFMTPLLNRVSRRHEFEADAYACEHADGSELASALVKLYQDNASTLTPDPTYVRFYYSHPPAAERLARLSGARPT